jgi:hypothetical protein
MTVAHTKNRDKMLSLPLTEEELEAYRATALGAGFSMAELVRSTMMAAVLVTADPVETGSNFITKYRGHYIHWRKRVAGLVDRNVV